MANYGGIDLGGTKIQTIVMRGEDHTVLGQARGLTPHQGGPSAVIDALVACMSEAAAALGRKDADRWLAKAVIDVIAAERSGTAA